MRASRKRLRTSESDIRKGFYEALGYVPRTRCSAIAVHRRSGVFAISARVLGLGRSRVCAPLVCCAAPGKCRVLRRGLSIRGRLPRHGNAPADAFGHRQGGVRRLHARKLRRDRRGERRGLSRRHVNVQRHVLRSCRQLAGLGMAQRFEIVQPLGVEIEQMESHAHCIAGVQLAQIAHMHFGGEAGVAGFLQVSEAAAE
jgi:hypothetical protein